MSKINRRLFLQAAGAASFGIPVLVKTQVPAKSSKVLMNSFDPRLVIDLKNIAWNLEQIRKTVNQRPVMAVIKANGYGHGVVRIAKFLEKRKVQFLAVGKSQEAFLVRKSGVNTPILNFGPFSNDEAEPLVLNNISQSVYTDGVENLVTAARKINRIARIHIKIDTGLGRIGIPYDEALSFIQKVASMPEVSIEGIFTTFTEDPEFDAIQLDRFQSICTDAQKLGISIGLRHAASSAAILAFPPAHLDIVRPGITLYGHYPSKKEDMKRKIDLHPAMSLKTQVIMLKNLRPGDSVSYHRKFKAQKETFVATLPIGYSDGYPYLIGNKGRAIIDGHLMSLLTEVTSNHMTLNVTGSQNIKIGDEAVLIGKQRGVEVKAEEVADWAGTSVYKIVIGMNPSLPRFYLEG